MTDNEFDVIKLDAMQTELANLMKGISGIQDAKVMVNIPEEEVFVSETSQEASASIVLQIEPGYDIQPTQVETLYNLVSKSIPNLSKDNIVIMDQNFNYFDQNSSELAQGTDSYTYQASIKEEIERDIQQRVQKMLGTMIGHNRVVASVTADIDFTQENRTESLVEPFDEEEMEGLPISIERIEEAYEGGVPVGGVAGTGEEDVPGYEAVDGDGEGNYERTKETINNEYNRIQKEIQESPYKIRDLGIQVAVDNTKAEGEQIVTLTQQEQMDVEEGIQSILSSMISTSVDQSYGEIDVVDKTSIVFQPFEGITPFEQKSAGIPTWIFAAGGGFFLFVILLVWLLLRRKKEDNYEHEEIFEELVSATSENVAELKEQETEATIRKKQLETNGTGETR